jgi:hypothetical protein
MGGKNKGGREIRKPKQAKQAKKLKTTTKATPSLSPSSQRLASDTTRSSRSGRPASDR